MTDENSSENAEQPTEPDNDGSTPTDTPAGVDPDTRIPDSAEFPEYMRGKTLREVAQGTDALMQTVEQGSAAQNQQAQQQQAQRQQSAAQQQQQVQRPNPDLYYEDPQEYNRRMDQYTSAVANQAVSVAAQQFQPMMQNMGQSAKQLAKQDADVADVFQSYEQEIVAEMANIPQNQRTVDAWKTAAELVAGRHRKELAQQEAERLAAEQQQPSPTNRQGGGQAAPDERSYRDEIDKFWHNNPDHEYVRFAKQNDVTPADLRSRARAMDMEPAQFVELIRRDAIQASAAGLTATEQ